MSLKNNTQSLQEVLEILSTKASGGEQATPEILINSSTGEITATAGSKTTTYQMAFQAAKTITPSTVTQVAISSGHYAGGSVTVAAVPTQSKSVTPTSSAQNIVPDSGKFLSQVTVASVPTQSKAATPTSAVQTITPDSGKFLSKVTVNSIPNSYVQPTSTKAAATYTPTTIAQTIASGTYLTGTQTIAGDTNLVPANIVSGKTIFGVSGTATAGGGANEEEIIAEFLETGPTVIENGTATRIRDYAFYNCSKLTSVSFPVCSNIMNDAFYSCSNLTSISFPVCSYIGDYAFYYCFKLTSVNFPVCSYIGDDAFYKCSNLTSISFPVCSYIGDYAFYSCSNLTSISFPVCSYIEGYAFAYCSKLTSVSFPVCSNIMNNVFYECSNLTSISFPVCSYIGGYAFGLCRTLSHVQLGASIVCKLSRSNAFSSTPFAGYSSYFSGTPHIYVPASLVSAYQSATNWTYFSSYFSAIPGSEEEDSGDNPEDNEGNLITFAINDTEYQALDGMTWAEWVNSEYNTLGLHIEGNIIAFGSGPRTKYILDNNFNYAQADMFIVSGYSYNLA